VCLFKQICAIIFQCISNKMQHCTVFLYLETALHVSDVTSTHHQERRQLYLQHLLFVTPLLLTAAIAAVSSIGVTNIRCCRYSLCAPDNGWWYHPKHVEQFPDKINCATLHLVGYILEYWHCFFFNNFSTDVFQVVNVIRRLCCSLNYKPRASSW
jgi:hypothetical protein